MELCMSPTLAEALDGGPLDVRDAVAMVDDLASAVDALAARGLAPRQLSPHSIHLHHRRGAVLADAGVPATVVPRLEVVCRARQYVSPEEVAGHRATRRSLVYTLGSILRESVSNEATAVLGDVIERATADSPGSRYAHPRAFASAAVAAAIGVGAVPANGARPQPASRVAPAAGRKARAARPREPRRNLAAVARSALGTARTTAARTAAVAARAAAVVARSAAATGRAAVAATRTVPQRAGAAARTTARIGQRRQPRRRWRGAGRPQRRDRSW